MRESVREMSLSYTSREEIMMIYKISRRREKFVAEDDGDENQTCGVRPRLGSTWGSSPYHSARLHSIRLLV